jgi:hypothetical protein
VRLLSLVGALMALVIAGVGGFELSQAPRTPAAEEQPKTEPSNDKDREPRSPSKPVKKKKGGTPDTERTNDTAEDEETAVA